MMAESREHLEKAIIVVRRLISDMSPAVLEKLGLDAAIRQIVNRFIKSFEGRVTFYVARLPVVDTPFAMVVFRALQECFTNILRHSLATDINVSLTLVDRVLRLRVEDNGVGFHVEEGLGRQNCYGLIGIRERVTLLGGRFRIRSTRESGGKKEDNPASGTRIDIELPIPDRKP
jgi:signal transduction histidine kinase